MFKAYEKLGDERAAIASEKRRIVDEARAQADKLLADARAEAEGILAEARTKGESMTAEAQAPPEEPIVTAPQPETAAPLPPRERPKKKKGRRR